MRCLVRTMNTKAERVTIVPSFWLIFGTRSPMGFPWGSTLSEPGVQTPQRRQLRASLNAGDCFLTDATQNAPHQVLCLEHRTFPAAPEQAAKAPTRPPPPPPQGWMAAGLTAGDVPPAPVQRCLGPERWWWWGGFPFLQSRIHS